MLADRFGEPILKTLSKYDVCAVWYDWDTSVVEMLKDALDKTRARIVVSSDWRQTKQTAAMRALFKLHGLDVYFDECLPAEGKKHEVISGYLTEHADEIGGWAVVDDWPMDDYFGDHFVLTCNRLAPADCDLLVEVLLR